MIAVRALAGIVATIFVDLSVTIPLGPGRPAAALVFGAGVVTAGVSSVLFYVAFRRPDAHTSTASRQEEIVTR